MEMTCQAWKAGTDEFVPHHVLADYIQESAEANGILDSTHFSTRVNQVRKDGGKWAVDVAKLSGTDSEITITDSTQVSL